MFCLAELGKISEFLEWGGVIFFNLQFSLEKGKSYRSQPICLFSDGLAYSWHIKKNEQLAF